MSLVQTEPSPTLQARRIAPDLELVRASAACYATHAQWASAEVNLYKMAHRHGWLPQIRAEFFAALSMVEEKILRSASRFKTPSQWRKHDSRAYKCARQNAKLWQRVVAQFPRGGWTKGGRTYEACRDDARDYVSMGRWLKHNRAAYMAARRHGWIERLRAEVWPDGPGAVTKP